MDLLVITVQIRCGGQGQAGYAVVEGVTGDGKGAHRFEIRYYQVTLTVWLGNTALAWQSDV